MYRRKSTRGASITASEGGKEEKENSKDDKDEKSEEVSCNISAVELYKASEDNADTGITVTAQSGLV